MKALTNRSPFPVNDGINQQRVREYLAVDTRDKFFKGSIWGKYRADSIRSMNLSQIKKQHYHRALVRHEHCA